MRVNPHPLRFNFISKDGKVVGCELAPDHDPARSRPNPNWVTPVSKPQVALCLRELLEMMIRRADYVCAHRYGHAVPVGTRILAIEDLRHATERARGALLEMDQAADRNRRKR